MVTWYNLIQLYGCAMFDNIKLAEGIDKEILTNSIIDECAYYPPSETDLNFLTFKITNYFNKKFDTFKRMFEACSVDYNVLHNYDKKETVIDTTTSESIDNNLNKVSAYDSNSFTDDSSENNQNNFNSEFIHENITQGNIGVTTSQQMLESELNIRPKLNIYDIITKDFFMNFCLNILD